MTTAADVRAELQLQVIWSRLTAIVEEQAQSLMRTAFSSTVREAGDLSSAIFDAEGRMIAQAVTGTPGHVNTLEKSVSYVLKRFPIASIQAGDQFITNDPWLASGHLHDLTVVGPVFYKNNVVGFFACCCHQVDIGGLGQGADGRSIFEEGLQIPPMKLVKAGELNQDLLDIVCQNVRTPFEVRGDIMSYVTCNEVAARHLVAMLNELDLDDLQAAADVMLERSKRAVTSAIAKLPKGTWRHSIIVDGYDVPIKLQATLTIAETDITVDYDGSSSASPFGINVVANYCLAYTAYALKCIVAPDVPNNTGSLSPFHVSAPAGSILNVRRPWPVSARHVIGLMLPDVVFGCLHQALPGTVPAEGASCNWTLQLRRGPDQAGDGPPFEVVFFNTGGVGARPQLDGLSATAFPSGVKAMPVEVIEQGAPIVIWRKELRVDSGGAGLYRGGLGVTVEVGTRHSAPYSLLAMFERIDSAAQGRAGGRPGAPGRVYCAGSQARLRGKGLQQIPGGERLVLETPGGGGYGDPRQRAAELLREDLRFELVSPEAAASDYGTTVSFSGTTGE